jgi:two-component system, sensor histidine kinase LadS
MMKAILCVCFGFPSILLSNDIYCQSGRELIIEPTVAEKFHYPIANYLDVFSDSTGLLKIGDVRSLAYRNRFLRNDQWLKSKIKVHWLRLKVKSNLLADREFLSYIQGSIVEFYDPTDSSSASVRRSGLLVPLSQRDQKNWFGQLPYISIIIKQGTKQTFYWRVNTEDFPYTSVHTNLPPSLSSFEYVLKNNHYSFFVFISVSSILLGLALYYLAIFILTKDKLFVYAFVYALCACAFVMYYKGYLLELVMPGFPKTHYQYGDTVVTLALLISTFFLIRHYFELSKWAPVYYGILKILIVLKVCLTVASTMVPSLLPISYYDFILLMMFLEFLGFVMIFKKHPLARYYLSAFTLFNLGLIINALFALVNKEQGIWDFGDLGLLGLNGLLAVGLSNRINVQKAELEKIVLERTIEIEKQKEKLSRLNLLKDKLFSVISHDIRGPMNQMASTLYMIEKDALTREEIRELVPTIRKNLDANSSFMQDLLTWAKSQFEGAVVKLEPCNLNGLIEINLSLLKPVADVKGIELKNNVHQPVRIRVDSEMIKLVIRNLISNAIKFTPNGGLIEISAQTEGRLVSVFVKDNGTGMSAEDIHILFSTQIKTTRGTANEKGTGVGLLICKDFVEKNGGKIWVESIPGKGSTFAFSVALV